MIRILFLLFLSFGSTCIATTTETHPAPKIKEHFHYQTFTLKNGLQVVIIPNTRAPVVYHSLWYKVGSADSPENKTGLAHFLEHLMFKGTSQFPKDTFKRTINNLGGEQNANTTWDRTAYFVTISKEHLPKVMEMEADRMQNLVLVEDEVEKEKEVVLQERRSMVDSKPETRLSEAANTAFFWQHPYGKPVIGFEEHIRQYTKKDAEAFYKTWYAPNNAILVIAGDVTVDNLKPLIQRYYGKLKPQSNLPIRQRPIEPNHRGTTSRVEIRDPQANGLSLKKIYAAPNFRAGSHVEATLTLLQDILGDHTQGRLSTILVENQKLAHYATAHYTGHYHDPYSFVISSAPVNGSDLSLLEASIEGEIRRLITEGITQAELDQAKKQWIYESLYRQDSLHGIANYFGENLSMGYGFKDLENWLEALEKVTPNDIKQVAKEIFSAGPRVTMVAYPVAQK